MDNMMKLKRALRRLERSKGRVARNNARRDVRRAVRGILRAMDSDYPIIPRQHKPRASTAGLTTKEQRIARSFKRLRAAGFAPIVELSAHDHGVYVETKLADLAAAAVRVKRDPRGGVWAPVWTGFIAPGDVAMLCRCKRSRSERAALESRARLGGAA